MVLATRSSCRGFASGVNSTGRSSVSDAAFSGEEARSSVFFTSTPPKALRSKGRHSCAAAFTRSDGDAVGRHRSSVQSRRNGAHVAVARGSSDRFMGSSARGDGNFCGSGYGSGCPW